MKYLRALTFALLLVGCAPAQAQTPPDAASILTLLTATGLPIDNVVVETAESDPNHLLGRPGGYTSRVTWRDTRLAVWIAGKRSLEDGGTIEVYPTAKGAQQRGAVLVAMSEAAPAIGEYDAVQGNAVLRLSRVLTPAQATDYQTAFRAVAS